MGFSLSRVVKSGRQRKQGLRLIAIVLLAGCSGFSFPETHYSNEKMFEKSQSPLTEVCSLLCDDVEDSNDVSTGAHVDVSVNAIEFTFLYREGSPNFFLK